IGTTTRWGAYRFGILTLIPVLLIAASWQWLGNERASSYAEAVDSPDYPGAIARTGSVQTPENDGSFAPSPVALTSDWSSLSTDCTPSERNPELNLCRSATAGEPSKRIVVVGESHSRQYLAALRPIAEERNWQLVEMLRSACPFSTRSEVVRGSQGCIDWNAAAAEEIIDMQPDAVFTMATREVREGLTEHTPPGFVEQWRKLDAAGIPVIGMRDNPRFEFEPVDCVDQRGADDPGCAAQRDAVLAPKPPYAAMPDVPDNVRFIDMSDYVCEERTCPPVIGNVYVYMDNNHLSATYLKTMSPILARELDRAMKW
ncbi:hypothetical protein EV191_113141, partial [Tamaricihabitans halophyticus]